MLCGCKSKRKCHATNSIMPRHRPRIWSCGRRNQFSHVRIFVSEPPSMCALLLSQFPVSTAHNLGAGSSIQKVSIQHRQYIEADQTVDTREFVAELWLVRQRVVEELSQLHLQKFASMFRAVFWLVYQLLVKMLPARNRLLKSPRSLLRPVHFLLLRHPAEACF